MDNIYTSKTADFVLFYFIQNSKKNEKKGNAMKRMHQKTEK